MAPSRAEGERLRAPLVGSLFNFYLVAQPLDPPKFEDDGLRHLLQKIRRNQTRNNRGE
jgi:hypothetical protein